MVNDLTKGNHNLDCSFSLLFKDQIDQRDERPMVYPGNLVFPSPVAMNKHFFFGCDLRKSRRTIEVSQLASKCMKVVEDDLVPHVYV